MMKRNGLFACANLFWNVVLSIELELSHELLSERNPSKALLNLIILAMPTEEMVYSGLKQQKYCEISVMNYQASHVKNLKN